MKAFKNKLIAMKLSSRIKRAPSECTRHCTMVYKERTSRYESGEPTMYDIDREKIGFRSILINNASIVRYQ